MSNIVEVVVADKNPVTMMRSVKATELAIELNKIGPFTVQDWDSDASNAVVHSPDAVLLLNEPIL